MALKVIGAGYGRTGTLTLKIALEMLGFGPCHHMSEVIGKPEMMAFWNRVADGEEIDWEEGLGAFNSTVDWPSCAYYAELADAYPEAKVILSHRDSERWYESMADTILKFMPMSGMLNPPTPENQLRFGGLIVAGKAFGHDLSRENLIASYERHNAEVQQRIPPERLLVFDPAQGWAPLCAFLGVPAPAEDFPRANSREKFWDIPRENAG